MNNFKNTPASMRYLGARLKPFRRPMFWGSIGLASLIGLAIYQYWQHPDWLNGNLSEVETNNYSSTSKLSNSIDREQISAEDLAIGAELDNLDLLLTELAQNQAITLEKVPKPNKSNNSLQSNNKDTIYHRFQNQQKSKLYQSPKPLISNKTTKNNLVESPSRNIFKLRSFNSYNPILSNSKKSTSSSSELIPNPVGRLYLNDRDQLNNMFRQNIPSGSVNSFSPINPISTTTETTDKNLSTQKNPSFTTSEIRSNPGGENIPAITPSPIPYNNNINATPITPRPTYGQPIYQQPTNLGITPGVAGSQIVNTSPTRFQPSTLSNQEQTQRYYQLTPSNYQLQPNVNNGFTSPPNSGFNSQPNNFSDNGSFTNSQFNNN